MRWIVPTSLLLVVLALAAGVDAAGTGVRGTVTKGPSCPVEREPPDPGCAPQGFTAKVSIFRLSDRKLVKRLYTDADGRFKARLRPGRYGVRARSATGGLFPRCPGPVKVRVRSGRYTRVAIECDTGIR
jgi:hypothetical protein